MHPAKSLLAVLVAGVGFAGLARADNLHFGLVNDTGAIYFNAAAPGATLTTTVSFKATSITAGTATFDVSISNTSSGDGNNRFVSFGIDVVSPTINGASAGGGWGASRDVNFPSFQQVDLCVWDGSNCSGGGGSGVGEGGTATFVLTLTTSGNFLTSGIDFTSPYAGKFQAAGTNNNSYEVGGCVIPKGSTTCDGGGGSNEIPEPTSLLLAGLGLVGLGALRRGRRV
jgi:hypothetical protein